MQAKVVSCRPTVVFLHVMLRQLPCFGTKSALVHYIELLSTALLLNLVKILSLFLSYITTVFKLHDNENNKESGGTYQGWGVYAFVNAALLIVTILILLLRYYHCPFAFLLD